MIFTSLRMMRRLIREIERDCGSRAELHYFDGMMPSSTDARAEGNKIAIMRPPDNFVADVIYGDEPELVRGAKYWRLLNNDGNVVLQGDWWP